MLAGFNVRGHRSPGSKTDRAMPLAAQAEGGLVKVLQAPWNRDLLSEFELFRYGRHDDIVDSTGLAFSRVVGGKRLWFRMLGEKFDPDAARNEPRPPANGKPPPGRFDKGSYIEETESAAMGRQTVSHTPTERGIRLDGPGWYNWISP
jgi:hypothetical protein